MLWRRIDNPGHEWARLSGPASTPVLRGTAVFMEDGIPGRLDYRIACDAAWETSSADVLGWVGDRKVKLRIEKSRQHAWRVNGAPAPEVEGCLDIDLSFSPSTNLLPIRRLRLDVGQEAVVRAAWLVFPGMELRPLVQRFRRESETRYAYASDSGFSTGLTVNEEGFVIDYPPLWSAVPG